MGSSPLTRGKQPAARTRAGEVGLIPAHAGKTPAGGARRIRRRAHPRSRGENLIGGCLIAPGQGSSPLTRGKRRHLRSFHPKRGLIPAHAGKTSYAATIVACFAAHPRSRGENPSPVRPMSQ